MTLTLIKLFYGIAEHGSWHLDGMLIEEVA